jgi:hypothetical protein
MQHAHRDTFIMALKVIPVICIDNIQEKARLSNSLNVCGNGWLIMRILCCMLQCDWRTYICYTWRFGSWTCFCLQGTGCYLCCQSGLPGFWTLSIVQCSKEHWSTQRVGYWMLFRPQVRGWGTRTLLSPLERAKRCSDIGCPVIEVSSF